MSTSNEIYQCWQIACAKAIADAAEEVAAIAKELAEGCTDRRMRAVRWETFSFFFTL